MGEGFLGYETSLMLDVVVVALAVVVPVLTLSLCQVHFGRRYQVHRRLQLLLGAVLFVAVSLFEVDMRLHGGFWAMSKNHSTEMHVLLGVHLFFAISTVVLWATTIGLALRRFPSPSEPGAHSRLHRRLGWLSTLDITATSITGLLVYYFGFVIEVVSDRAG
jgi:putative membrane protein